MRPSRQQVSDVNYLTQTILMNLDPAVLAHGRGELNNEHGITSWAFDDLIMDLCWGAAVLISRKESIIDGIGCADIECEEVANKLVGWMTKENIKFAWTVLGLPESGGLSVYDEVYVEFVEKVILK